MTAELADREAPTARDAIRIGYQFTTPPAGLTSLEVGDIVVWINSRNQARVGQVKGFFVDNDGDEFQGKWRVAVGYAAPLLERVGVPQFDIADADRR